MDIAEIEPEERFSWRWHPGANLENDDLTSEPQTLVVFQLADENGGTRVTVTETGFDQLFEHRRAQALLDNQGGWDAQVVNLQRYATNAPAGN